MDRIRVSQNIQLFEVVVAIFLISKIHKSKAVLLLLFEKEIK